MRGAGRRDADDMVPGIPSNGKPGPDSVNPSSQAGCTVYNSPGSPGESMAAQPIPGPQSTGGPVALKKALAKKSMPNMGRNSPGRY